MIKAERKMRLSGVLFAALAIFVFLLVLRNSSVAIEYMKSGLNVCVQTVIPSLFPFMVISELLIGTGAGDALGRALSFPMKKLFGISGSGCCAFFLGSLCGFPIGAKTAVSLYSKGMISHDELTFLLTFSNNPGSAFVISAMGVALFSNKALGIMMYCCVILSAVTVGIVGSFFFRRKISDVPNSDLIAEKRSNAGIFTSAVRSSASSMLYVCAYVVFFSAVVGCLQSVLSDIYIPQWLYALIFGFFEISSGVCRAAEIENPSIAHTVCGFIAGWSGLSVHFQIMSVCADCKVSFKPFFLAKFCQGILCALYIFLCSRFIFPMFSESQTDTSAFLSLKPHPWLSVLSMALFAASVIIGLIVFLYRCYSRRKVMGKF